ncbi:ABC transporter permease [Streptomyces sp. NA04227]|uniref:ABC transporter permease n=1 Tax=Streptomyces sp. NA04227 TaxID=2742136 RepID=UPI0015915FD9|nr:ABC transporter permease [Streptomyces sp. NA04227]QKW08001.1 ABC transporter permease [Streptomyces sp. NA04227]
MSEESGADTGGDVPEDGDRDGGEGRSGGGAHARTRRPRERWSWFRGTPFWPATVLVVILALAAGLFAGSYTYSMAKPTPHHIPIGVTGDVAALSGKSYIADLERELDTSLSPHRYDTRAEAVHEVQEQNIFAIVDVAPGGRAVEFAVSSASGASVADVLTRAAPQVAEEAGVKVRVRDLNPLQEGDPRGLAIFYITLAAVIVGFVGSIQLSVHGRDLGPLARIVFTSAYSMLGALVIVGVVDWWIGAVDLPEGESWVILALTMFTSGMVSTMFTTLFGRWAMLPTWGLLIILGNPSSGGAVSWPLLPTALRVIGRWLPPGASVSAQHTAVYFPHNQHAAPFLVLAAWALVGTSVFWFWRHRHPGASSTLPRGEHAAV